MLKPYRDSLVKFLAVARAPRKFGGYDGFRYRIDSGTVVRDSRFALFGSSEKYAEDG